MDAQVRSRDVAVGQHTARARAPAIPVVIEPTAAANDELPGQPEPATHENPLWVINIAMAAFFIVTGLVMMFT
jgi:hypothetical protein